MEIELQYLYTGEEPLIVPVELAGFSLAGSAVFDIRDSFYDTVDLDLRLAGCSLRIRRQSNLPSPILTWKGPSTRRADRARQREEIEAPVAHIPTSGAEVVEMLKAVSLHDKVAAAVDKTPVLALIGELQNRRSTHEYVQGLHRVEMCWDRLNFPLGPPQIRLELETQSTASGRFISSFDEGLRRVFGDTIGDADYGKAKELCVRLYPEIFGASVDA